MSAAKVFDLSTGKELVEVKKTNRKTFHKMDDGSMVSYFTPSMVESKVKRLGKKALSYFFDLEEETVYKK